GRHTRWPRDWSSDVCSSDLGEQVDLRVDAADVVHLDREPPPGRGEEVGQEDVGRLDQAVEEVAPGGAAEVETDAPLAAVRLLDHEVDAARRRDEARGDEPALRVAARRVLDLDHVRA